MLEFHIPSPVFNNYGCHGSPNNSANFIKDNVPRQIEAPISPPPLPGIPRAFDCAGGEFEPDLSLHSQDTISPLLANNSFKRIFKRSLKMP